MQQPCGCCVLNQCVSCGWGSSAKGQAVYTTLPSSQCGPPATRSAVHARLLPAAQHDKVRELVVWQARSVCW